MIDELKALREKCARLERRVAELERAEDALIDRADRLGEVLQPLLLAYPSINGSIGLTANTQEAVAASVDEKEVRQGTIWRLNQQLDDLCAKLEIAEKALIIAATQPPHAENCTDVPCTCWKAEFVKALAAIRHGK